MSFRGWETTDQWWFLYAGEPTFRCPYGIAPNDADEKTRAAVAKLGAELGMDPEKVLRMLLGSRHGVRERVNDKPTDRCFGCGAKMRRDGYLAYVERPATEDELQIGDQISRRVFGAPPMRRVKSIYLPTRREAKLWAWEGYDIHRKALAEEAERS